LILLNDKILFDVTETKKKKLMETNRALDIAVKIVYLTLVDKWNYSCDDRRYVTCLLYTKIVLNRASKLKLYKMVHLNAVFCGLTSKCMRRSSADARGLLRSLRLVQGARGK